MMEIEDAPELIGRCQKCGQNFYSDDEDACDQFCGKCVNELLQVKPEIHIDSLGRPKVPPKIKGRPRFSDNMARWPGRI